MVPSLDLHIMCTIISWPKSPCSINRNPSSNGKNKNNEVEAEADNVVFARARISGQTSLAGFWITIVRFSKQEAAGLVFIHDALVLVSTVSVSRRAGYVLPEATASPRELHSALKLTRT